LQGIRVSTLVFLYICCERIVIVMAFDPSNLCEGDDMVSYVEGELMRVRPSVQLKVESNAKMYLQVTHL